MNQDNQFGSRQDRKRWNMLNRRRQKLLKNYPLSPSEHRSLQKIDKEMDDIDERSPVVKEIRKRVQGYNDRLKIYDRFLTLVEKMVSSSLTDPEMAELKGLMDTLDRHVGMPIG